MVVHVILQGRFSPQHSADALPATLHQGFSPDPGLKKSLLRGLYFPQKPPTDWANSLNIHPHRPIRQSHHRGGGSVADTENELPAIPESRASPGPSGQSGATHTVHSAPIWQDATRHRRTAVPAVFPPPERAADAPAKGTVSLPAGFQPPPRSAAAPAVRIRFQSTWHHPRTQLLSSPYGRKQSSPCSAGPV